MPLEQPYMSLGIFASGNAGNLTLSLASGDFEDGATITAGAQQHCLQLSKPQRQLQTFKYSQEREDT